MSQAGRSPNPVGMLQRINNRTPVRSVTPYDFRIKISQMSNRFRGYTLVNKILYSRVVLEYSRLVGMFMYPSKSASVLALLS